MSFNISLSIHNIIGMQVYSRYLGRYYEYGKRLRILHRIKKEMKGETLYLLSYFLVNCNTDFKRVCGNSIENLDIQEIKFYAPSDVQQELNVSVLESIQSNFETCTHEVYYVVTLNFATGDCSLEHLNINDADKLVFLEKADFLLLNSSQYKLINKTALIGTSPYEITLASDKFSLISGESFDSLLVASCDEFNALLTELHTKHAEPKSAVKKLNISAKFNSNATELKDAVNISQRFENLKHKASNLKHTESLKKVSLAREGEFISDSTLHIDPVVPVNPYHIKKFNLSEFKKRLMQQGLIYSDEDLINFHACVDSNYLTILSGFSGTGKSALSKAYVQYISQNGNELDESRFVMIPVSTQFKDSTAVCGFYDYATHVYTPDKNGFLNLVREANLPGNRNKLYYAIFDEINLAPVEHWFSDFISKMESNDDLLLYDEHQLTYNSNMHYNYKYSLNNLKFIGTMNENETDARLNMRVIDRASKVELEPPDLIEIIKLHLVNHNIVQGKQLKRFIELITALDTATRDTVEFQQRNNRDYSNIGKFYISPRIAISSIDYLQKIEMLTDNSAILESLMEKLFCQRLFSKLGENDNKLLIKTWGEVCLKYNLNTAHAKLTMQFSD